MRAAVSAGKGPGNAPDGGLPTTRRGHLFTLTSAVRTRSAQRVGMLAALAVTLLAVGPVGPAAGAKSNPPRADAARIATAYVRDHAQQLGLKPADVTAVKSEEVVSGTPAQRTSTSPSGTRGSRFSTAILNVTVARDGSVASVANRFVPEPECSGQLRGARPLGERRAVQNTGRPPRPHAEGPCAQGVQGWRCARGALQRGRRRSGSRYGAESSSTGRSTAGRCGSPGRSSSTSGTDRGLVEHPGRRGDRRRDREGRLRRPGGSCDVFAIPKENPDDGPRGRSRSIPRVALR